MNIKIDGIESKIIERETFMVNQVEYSRMQIPQAILDAPSIYGPQTLLDHIRNNAIVHVIKTIRTITNMGLKECKCFIDQFNLKYAPFYPSFFYGVAPMYYALYKDPACPASLMGEIEQFYPDVKSTIKFVDYVASDGDPANVAALRKEVAENEKKKAEQEEQNMIEQIIAGTSFAARNYKIMGFDSPVHAVDHINNNFRSKFV